MDGSAETTPVPVAGLCCGIFGKHIVYVKLQT